MEVNDILDAPPVDLRSHSDEPPVDVTAEPRGDVLRPS
jgi:hypothetical protein